MRLAACQLAVSADKAENVRAAVEAVGGAARAGAQVVLLPEMFCCPYSTRLFREYSESYPGPTTSALSAAAASCGVWLVGGSLPESSESGGDALYNTCFVFSPHGQLVARHRKAHLFDIDVTGGIRFRGFSWNATPVPSNHNDSLSESETLTAGGALTTFETPWCPVGVGICYDVRFPEMWSVYSRARGCGLLCLPGAPALLFGFGRSLSPRLFLGCPPPLPLLFNWLRN